MTTRIIKLTALSCGIAAALSSCTLIDSLSVKELPLATDGKTDYAIVTLNKTPKDMWNARFLAWFLKEKTGADFPIVTADKADSTKPAIRIGAANKSMLKGMKDLDHVVKSRGKDILLYGQGYDADFYAIMDFLDREFGFRCYWNFPKIEKQPAVVLKPMNRKMGYAFKWRQQQGSFVDYLRGENGYFPSRNALDAMNKKVPPMTNTIALAAPPGSYPEIKPQQIQVNLCHTEFGYIPCACGDPVYKGYEFVENQDYSKTNPEFFGMNKAGVRSPKNMHLCFSNRDMRKEFTKNIEKHMAFLGTDAVEICVHYTDDAGKACYCKECEALEKKYGTPGGPVFDYIIEIAREFKGKHPQTTIMTLLYRENQTQFPPVMEDGWKFPDNVRFCYAGISFKTNRKISHPDNTKAYEDLKRWSALSDRIFTWVYHAHYGAMIHLPYAADYILVDYIREAHKLGIEGMFYEFATYSAFPSDEKKCTGLAPRNFAMLDKYLFYRFTKNPDLDYETEVTDYMNHAYGPAARFAKQYHDELQKAGTVDNPYPMVLSGINFNKELAYLSPDNLYRWEKLCDEMEKSLGDGHPDIMKKVRLLRRPLDTAVYGRWFDCAKKYPDYFSDPAAIRKRIGSPSSHPFAVGLKNFLARADLAIQYGGKGKPLPAEFAGISEDNIRRLVPVNGANGSYADPVQKFFEDPEAAFGYAISIDRPDYPFSFGFYQTDLKQHGARVKLEEKDYEPGKFKIYKLGEIQPTPQSTIWFSSKSWCTAVDTGSLYDLKDTNQKWDAWVSLKFPRDYKGQTNSAVLCDQVIFVKK
ncbi:MAG: DUF4838 domain-containing protein [Kiritimatiellia bacterium]